MSTKVVLSAEDEAEVERFAGNLFMAGLAALELANIELGIRLGLYDALAGAGAMTSVELAEKRGVNERYAREWLEQQAVAGVLDVEDVAAPPRERRFSLSNAHAHVLLDEDSEACMKPCAGVIPFAGKALDIMVDEFRRGTGVSFGAFELHDLQAAFTRPVFANRLVQSWLPGLPDLHARLLRGEAVRIAEVGCGEGLAALTIAKAFPKVTIDGFDLDDASIAVASAEAERGGVADRVRFQARDAGDPSISGDYDLVMAIEMLHDVPDPVSILRTMRRLAGDRGVVLVVDERAEDHFTAPANETERFLYAFSPLHCLAVSMQDEGAGTGTVMRADTVRQYATNAGFSNVDVLEVEHPQFRLYQLS
jgi:ubiquinone/menaquinone biosynthesis C-methylase UbiE